MKAKLRESRHACTPVSTPGRGTTKQKRNAREGPPREEGPWLNVAEAGPQGPGLEPKSCRMIYLLQEVCEGRSCE